jgi:hypothetical protein
MDVESRVLDKYLPVMRKATRVTLILSELVECDGGQVATTAAGLRDLSAICKDLLETANRNNSERKELRILFAGTASDHEPHFGYDDDDQVPDYSAFEDRLWRRAVDHLYDLLDIGVEMFLCSDPDDRVVIQELEPEDGRYGIEIEALNSRLRDLFTRRRRPIPPVLVQSRADYLRLTDISDELAQDTMDRMRRDEAWYHECRAEAAAEAKTSE